MQRINIHNSITNFTIAGSSLRNERNELWVNLSFVEMIDQIMEYYHARSPSNFRLFRSISTLDFHILTNLEYESANTDDLVYISHKSESTYQMFQ